MPSQSFSLIGCYGLVQQILILYRAFLYPISCISIIAAQLQAMLTCKVLEFEVPCGKHLNVLVGNEQR